MGSENSTQNWANLIEASLFRIGGPKKRRKKGTKKTSKNDPKKPRPPNPRRARPRESAGGGDASPSHPPLMGYENVFYYKHSMMFQMLLSSLFCRKILFFLAKSNQAIGFCHADHTLFEAPQGHSITTKGPFYNVQWVHFSFKNLYENVNS